MYHLHIKMSKIQHTHLNCGQPFCSFVACNSTTSPFLCDIQRCKHYTAHFELMSVYLLSAGVWAEGITYLSHVILYLAVPQE